MISRSASVRAEELPDAAKPWFRHSGPWLVLAPLITVVLGCIATAWLMLAHPDHEVQVAPAIDDGQGLPHSSVVPPEQ